MHIHWHRPVADLGVWRYQECRCGNRRAIRRYLGGHSPLDQRWLDGAEREPGAGSFPTLREAS